jgi:hypothetical protein
MHPTISGILGRTQARPISAAGYSHGGVDNTPADPSVSGAVAIPGVEFQGRVTAAMIGAIVVSLVLFHVVTKGYQL